MLKAADQLLVKQYPQAKLVPKATRQKIIHKMLDMVIDDFPKVLSDTGSLPNCLKMLADANLGPV